MVGAYTSKANASMYMVCVGTCSGFAWHPASTSSVLLTSIIDLSIVIGAVKDI